MMSEPRRFGEAAEAAVLVVGVRVRATEWAMAPSTRGRVGTIVEVSPGSWGSRFPYLVAFDHDEGPPWPMAPDELAPA
jgi:hypothetical protein